MGRRPQLPGSPWRTNNEDNQWAEILGAAFAPAILLVIVSGAEGQEALAVWEHIWQAVCRQP